MKETSRIPATSAFAFLLALAGCRTTEKVLLDYETDLRTGRYAKAAVEVGALAEKKDDSQLLWHLETAGALYLADDAAGAVRHFDFAEDAFAANNRMSAFAKAGEGTLSMVTNDRSFPYVGAGQDRVFTCLYKAVDYARQGQRDAARTELNRAAQHQENWIWERRNDVAASEKRMREDATKYANGEIAGKGGDGVTKAFANQELRATILEGAKFDTATSGNLATLTAKDYMNAYVAHVCGVFRWLNGDGGRDFLRDAAGLKPQNALIASDFQAADKGGRPKDQVWIYVEDGLCPIREQWEVNLPVILIPYANRYVWHAGMALPVLRYREAGASAYAASAGDFKTGLAELEDIDRLLKTEHDVFFRGALAREIMRVIIKAGVQAGFGVATQTTNSKDAQLAFTIAQAGAAVWSVTSLGADLRCWTTLPKRVYAGRVPRPADGVVRIQANGAPLAEVQLKPGNAMVFVRKPAPTAPPVVKVVSFP